FVQSSSAPVAIVCKLLLMRLSSIQSMYQKIKLDSLAKKGENRSKRNTALGKDLINERSKQRADGTDGANI
ncbi:MAG TPA: hypothetical protein VFC96_04815, partial [Anaerovoracaceae bacterium]|nr:hypothetical protein [Anaerovoracaceae bacterium]